MENKVALFLDRDGVINYDSGYTSTIEEFEFIDGIFDLCRAARAAGYLIIVVTNQAGIGRGYYSEKDFASLTEWMCSRFDGEDASVTDVFYCPYHPEYGRGSYRKDSFDRKPNPGMLLRAAKMYGIDLADSIMIGDKSSDMLAAKQAGVGIRCLYRAGGKTGARNNDATHGISFLRDGIGLLRKTAA